MLWLLAFIPADGDCRMTDCAQSSKPASVVNAQSIGLITKAVLANPSWRWCSGRKVPVALLRLPPKPQAGVMVCLKADAVRKGKQDVLGCRMASALPRASAWRLSLLISHAQALVMNLPLMFHQL